ncbi:MAG: energy transducer TonB, partial [Alphaproteobacteria bacterium]|nr:energy transducer TonB [Alphaproteobacteria bacterium]
MIARYTGALGISIVITFALFFLMHFLVARGENPLTDDDSVGRIDITMQDREEDVREKDRDKPEKQDVSQPPPPEMQQVQNTRPRAGNVGSRIGAFDTNVQLGDMEIGAAPSDRDVQPIVRIPPQYPRRAAERGLEGYVDLRFSISKTGSP